MSESVVEVSGWMGGCVWVGDLCMHAHMYIHANLNCKLLSPLGWVGG